MYWWTKVQVGCWQTDSSSNLREKQTDIWTNGNLDKRIFGQTSKWVNQLINK